MKFHPRIGLSLLIGVLLLACEPSSYGAFSEETAMDVGISAFSRGDYVTARNVSFEIIKENPGSNHAYALFADASLRLNDYKSVLIMYQLARSRKVVEPHLYRSAADIYYYLNFQMPEFLPWNLIKSVCDYEYIELNQVQN